MKNNLLFFLVFLLLFSCSHKKQIIYLNDFETNSLNKIELELYEKALIDGKIKYEKN